MEKNLGFFEAWRAKRREKKNEELEKISTVKTEGGVLAKYLKMRTQELSGIEPEVKNLNGEWTPEPGSSTEKPEVSKTDSRRSSVLNTTSAVSSRRSSFDSNSRRNSVISPLSSFSNLQERIQSLSQEQFQNDSSPKKSVKVNKLSEDVLKIGRQSSKDREEPLKPPPKTNTNLQSKLTKLGVASNAGKKTVDENSQKVVVKKKTVVKTKVETSESVEIKQNKAVEKVNDEGRVVGNQKLNLTSKDEKTEPATTAQESPQSKEVAEQRKNPEPLVKTKLTDSKSEETASSNTEVAKTNQEPVSEVKDVKEGESTKSKLQKTDRNEESAKKLPEEVKSNVDVAKSQSKTEVGAIKKSSEGEVSVLQKKTSKKVVEGCKKTSSKSDVKSVAKKTEESGEVKKESQISGKALTNVVKLQEKAEALGEVRKESQISEKTPTNVVRLLEKTEESVEVKKELQSSGRTPTNAVRLQKKTEESKEVRKESQTSGKISTSVVRLLEKTDELEERKEPQTSVKTLTNVGNLQEKREESVEVKKELQTSGRTPTNAVKLQEKAEALGEVRKESQISEKTPTNVVRLQEKRETSGKTPMNVVRLLEKTEESVEVKKESQTSGKTPTNVRLQESKDSKFQPIKSEILQKELIMEAVKFQKGMTILTNQLVCESPKPNEDKSEASSLSQESGSFRKDPKKLEKKIKPKSNPNECYPKTQKLLTAKPINAFEQVKLEESKTESVVSPSKVEAFLREAISPPTVSGEKEPVKTMEAVVEEILTSTSEKSKHEKPSKVRYTSRGEVICGVVSIKPSNKEEDTDGLSAITLVPAFRPENSILDKETMDDSDSVVQPNTENPVPEPPKRDCYSPTISDFSDDSYDHYIASIDYSTDSSYSRRRSLRSSSTPRRIFPQVVKPSPYRIDRTKEESPVVFGAGLTFDIGSNRTSLRHCFKPQPAFTDMKTTSSLLSMRISDFLKRTDHIMDEWKHLGKGGEDLQSLVQLPSSSVSGRGSSSSKSATNIMIKGLLNYSKGSRTSSLRSRSLAKTSEASDRTISDIDELSEMTLDLSEERATGTMQAERLEAETAERVRLEQELSQVQNEKKNLQQTSERLEMELFYARADVNGLSESEADLEDGGGDAALYKNKCERAMRELEFTRRRLQQQHEDDLEQLVALKKQLEKKLADAYEEVEEQRQVAAQWKRKVQKLQSETNDLRLLLEEQSSRNNLLEKKQRKFDSEIQMLQEELRSERNQKERLSREKEMAVAEKYSLEQNLSSVRLELELKEEKVSALSREVEELSRGGGTEQEVTQLRKAKHDLEMKLKEQEEELDELAGQVSMLEGNKLRLEMSLESLRKEHRREMAQRDDELDEVRANAQKKIKVLESQLESEHEERTLLVREKHELERRLADAEERGRHHRAADEDALQRARRDLKKTKALLRDAQVMLERAKQDSPSKAALRALKNQLEDAELARASAVKAKQSLESELNDVSGQLEEALRAKGDAENRCQAAVREMNSLRTQVDENEEELAELLKKYRQTVQQLSAEQLANQETASALAEAEAERASLRDQLAELTARLEANTVVDPISGIAQKKLEIRIKELESRLELELTTRGRLEVQITRLKENVERLNEECVQARTKEQAATDLTRKLQRSLREAKEELAAQQAKEQEAFHKRKELEKRLDTAETEAATAKTDLRLAVKRIEDLQSAISGEIGTDSDRTESDEEDSENDSLVSHVPSTLSSTSRTSRTPELTPR